MTNSWSMLYDEILKMDDYINLNAPNGNIDIISTTATPFKYNEEEIVKELLKIKPPFNINKIAEMAAVEALKDKSFILKSVKHNLKWAYKIKKNLELVKVDVTKIRGLSYYSGFLVETNLNFKAKNLKGKKSSSRC